MQSNIENQTAVQKPKKPDIFFVMLSIFLVLLIALTVIFNVKYSDSVRVSGNSMSPTIRDGDVLFMNTKVESKNGDIIVIDGEKFDSIREDYSLLIKRQIAKGEKGRVVVVELRDGIVYVDGKQIDEPYLKEGTSTNSTPSQDFTPGKTRWELQENQVFYLGDNRENSYDSRYIEYDVCDQSQIIGVVEEDAIKMKWISSAMYEVKQFFAGLFK